MMKPPPIAGANSVVTPRPIEFSATAFIRRSRLTSCGMIDWRAGIITGISPPWMMELTSR